MRVFVVPLGVMVVVLTATAATTSAEYREISKDRYLDKAKGAWAGQMIGVCFGWPYEFVFLAKPILEDLRPWDPESIKGAINQDDIYVEMTFLKALEDYGLDITHEQAGKAFGATEYQLWHANLFGRENIRHGIMPPASGSYMYNQHAGDIDFQIEADLLGIICPGMPWESNRLSTIFGRIMNDREGVYGGMFVAAMYTAAYFEDNDIRKVIDAGLAAIPRGSKYHQIVTDVIQWHDEHPGDWLNVWHKIEDKWQTDDDCLPGSPVNINATLNGAYIVMGLLYGEGDMARTIEVSTRCGQDADCNPSNAAGILGCMKGYNAIEDVWTRGISAMADTNFSYTDYSWKTLIPACQRMTEDIIARVGGHVDDSAYRIPIFNADEAHIVKHFESNLGAPLEPGPVTQRDLDFWHAGWKLIACGKDMAPGYNDKEFGRHGVLKLHPVDETIPAAIETTVTVPATNSPTFAIDVASYKSWRGEPTTGDFVLAILVNGDVLTVENVESPGKWQTVSADLTAYAGKEVTIRIENRATGWHYEGAYLSTVTLE